MTKKNRVTIKCKRKTCGISFEDCPSNHRKYCSRRCHFSDRPSGKKHFNWRGGKTLHNLGYITLCIGKKRVLEHRVVMEKILGRKLRTGELVHHKNENKKDNRPTNLQLISRAAHASLHHKGVPKPKRKYVEPLGTQ